MLRAKQVDGIIIFPTGDNLDLYKRMKSDQFPIVFMDRTIEELNIATVMLDNHLASKLAVDRFVEKGYENIAIITTSIIRDISPRIERIQGYKDSLASHGIPFNAEYIKTVNAEEIPNALSEFFELEKPPQAILAGNDIVLNEILRYMKKHDINIPEDIAVIGIDEVPYANFYTPTITTVNQPAIEMANWQQSYCLVRSIKLGKEDTSVHRLKPNLLSRNSC